MQIFGKDVPVNSKLYQVRSDGPSMASKMAKKCREDKLLSVRTGISQQPAQ